MTTSTTINRSIISDNHRLQFSRSTMRSIYIIVIIATSISIANGETNHHSLNKINTAKTTIPPTICNTKNGRIFIDPNKIKRKQNNKISPSAKLVQRGGSNGKEASSLSKTPPSFYWAVFHNWLYFLSLGFNALNVPFVVRSIIDKTTDYTTKPTAEAVSLSGKVESVDRLLTFLGIGFLSALSDKVGRKPLMAWSALGFALTNLIQAKCTKSVGLLYFADFVDGCSSCMLPLCQAYVTDCSSPERRATNLGIFQGISAGGAFIIAFPVGGLLGAKYGPRTPLILGALFQFLNALIILFITPESNPKESRPDTIDYGESNPIGGLHRLFCHGSLLRLSSAAFFFSALGRMALDAQFVNYANIRFGWSQAQSGPVLVVVGLMLAIAPRFLVPILGLSNSILYGLLVVSAGYVFAGLAPTPLQFASSIVIISVGCTAFPALQALLANLAQPGERGALLGAVASMNELVGAIGSTMYASLLGTFTAEDAPLALPGMHFLVGGLLFVIAWAVMFQGFKKNVGHPALDIDIKKDVEYEGLGD